MTKPIDSKNKIKGHWHLLPGSVKGKVMARSYRKKITGYPYLIFAESVSNRLLFQEEEDFNHYLTMLEQKARESHIEVYAFYLQPTALRLVIKPQKRDLSNLMQSLHGQHTRRINRKYQQEGSLFQGRFRSILFPPDQLAEVVRDVHLYPVRTGRFRQASSPQFSSHRAYVSNEPQWHHLLSVHPLLSQFHESRPVAQKAFERFVEAAALEPDLSGVQEIIPGVYLPEDLIDFFQLKQKQAPTAPAPSVTISTLLEEVCLLFQITPSVLTGTSQKARWVMARKLFVTAAISYAGHRQSQIATVLQRHKSQISRLLRQGEEDRQHDEVFKELYLTLTMREEGMTSP
jgi:putative transposase